MESPAADREKKLRTLRKKLRQVEELKQRSGSLDPEVQKKIDSEQVLRTEIASLESPETASLELPPAEGEFESDTGKCDLLEEIERALEDVPSHAALLLGASEKPFRALQKSLRDIVKLQKMDKLEQSQVEKLRRLTEEAPLLLSTYRPLRSEAMELAAGYSDRQIVQLKAEREALAATREAAKVAAATATAAASSRPQALPEGAPPHTARPRIGIDVGGVLNKFLNDNPSSDKPWELMRESEAPGAMDALAKCVMRFGSANTFILSKCSGEMRRTTETWLFQTMGICDETIGVRKKNVYFCTERFGRNGKGSVAAALQLSHFVDDRDDCLWSVYEEGRSQAHVELHSGRFFHMARGANGRWPPQPREWPAEERPACVAPVREWSEVLHYLGID